VVTLPVRDLTGGDEVNSLVGCPVTPSGGASGRKAQIDCHRPGHRLPRGGVALHWCGPPGEPCRVERERHSCGRP